MLSRLFSIDSGIYRTLSKSCFVLALSWIGVSPQAEGAADGFGSGSEPFLGRPALSSRMQRLINPPPIRREERHAHFDLPLEHVDTTLATSDGSSSQISPRNPRPQPSPLPSPRSLESPRPQLTRATSMGILSHQHRPGEPSSSTSSVLPVPPSESQAPSTSSSSASRGATNHGSSVLSRIKKGAKLRRSSHPELRDLAEIHRAHDLSRLQSRFHTERIQNNVYRLRVLVTGLTERTRKLEALENHCDQILKQLNESVPADAVKLCSQVSIEIQTILGEIDLFLFDRFSDPGVPGPLEEMAEFGRIEELHECLRLLYEGLGAKEFNARFETINYENHLLSLIPRLPGLIPSATLQPFLKFLLKSVRGIEETIQDFNVEWQEPFYIPRALRNSDERAFAELLQETPYRFCPEVMLLIRYASHFRNEGARQVWPAAADIWFEWRKQFPN